MHTKFNLKIVFYISFLFKFQKKKKNLSSWKNDITFFSVIDTTTRERSKKLFILYLKQGKGIFLILTPNNSRPSSYLFSFFPLMFSIWLFLCESVGKLWHSLVSIATRRTCNPPCRALVSERQRTHGEATIPGHGDLRAAAPHNQASGGPY